MAPLPGLLSYGSWGRLRPPSNPELDTWRKVDGWMFVLQMSTKMSRHKLSDLFFFSSGRYLLRLMFENLNNHQKIHKLFVYSWTHSVKLYIHTWRVAEIGHFYTPKTFLNVEALWLADNICQHLAEFLPRCFIFIFFQVFFFYLPSLKRDILKWEQLRVGVPNASLFLTCVHLKFPSLLTDDDSYISL